MKKIRKALSFLLCITFITPISVMGEDSDVLARNQMRSLRAHEVLSNSNISDYEYGGEFLDENLNLVVNVLESNETISAFARSNDAIYRKVKYSLADLENARYLLLDALLEYNSNQIFVISRNLMENRIEVIIADVTEELVSKLGAIGLPSDIFVIIEEEFSHDVALVEDVIFDINEEDVETNSIIDIINGDMITSNTGFSSLGVGAVTVGSGGQKIYGILTHGHGSMAVGRQISHRGQHMGHVNRLQMSGNVDASFIPIDGLDTSFRITNEFLDGSTFTSFGFNPPVGTPVTRYGTRTFSSTGPILDNDATINYPNITLHNMVTARVDSISGDSGGPYKAMDANGVYHIVGIHSGRSTSGETIGIYTNMLNIMRAFNVEPVTGSEIPPTPPIPPEEGIREWAINVNYSVGDLVRYRGQVYRCTIAHFSTEQFTPILAPILWQLQ